MAHICHTRVVDPARPWVKRAPAHPRQGRLKGISELHAEQARAFGSGQPGGLGQQGGQSEERLLTRTALQDPV